MQQMMLNNNFFLGIEEITFRLYLKPLSLPWYKKIFQRFKSKKTIRYDLVGPLYPNRIECEIKIQRSHNNYQQTITINQTETKDPIYVNLPQ